MYYQFNNSIFRYCKLMTLPIDKSGRQKGYKDHENAVYDSTEIYYIAAIDLRK